MRTYLQITAAIVVFFIGFTSCKQEPRAQFYFEYFGFDEGLYVIYDVIEMNHDDTVGVHDTIEYQLKTVWGPVFVDNEGRNAREFKRFTRLNPSYDWVLADLWTGLFVGNRAELIEENQRIVKLVFAPELNKLWNANAYNMMGKCSCYYRDIHEEATINTASFDSTLVVEIDEYYSLIDTVHNYEMYAKNIGLVYSYFVDNHFQIGNSTIVKGIEYFHTYNSHGYE